MCNHPLRSVVVLWDSHRLNWVLRNFGTKCRHYSYESLNFHGSSNQRNQKRSKHLRGPKRRQRRHKLSKVISSPITNHNFNNHHLNRDFNLHFPRETNKLLHRQQWNQKWVFQGHASLPPRMADRHVAVLRPSFVQSPRTATNGSQIDNKRIHIYKFTIDDFVYISL